MDLVILSEGPIKLQGTVQRDGTSSTAKTPLATRYRLGFLRCDKKQCAELMQALEVWSTVLFELLLHGFEVDETISDDGTALIVETLLPVQKIDNTAADHRIERHEGAFNLC